jgi:hypothetical protein
MGLLDKILSSQASNLVDGVGKVIDESTTSIEEKLEQKAKIMGLITDFVSKSTQFAADVVKTEATGNWLQRSWRPIVMLAFAFIVVYRFFLSPVFGFPGLDLPQEFWSLLEIGLGGYVIGRSVEKVTSTITDKMDIVPDKLKKTKKHE